MEHKASMDFANCLPHHRTSSPDRSAQPTYQQPTLRIQIVSDTHLEIYNTPFEQLVQPAGASVVCLLGDIGFPTQISYRRFVEYCSKNFEHVLLLAGNHEYYNPVSASGKTLGSRTIQDTVGYINSVVAEHNNVHFLNNSTITIGHCQFIGSTLWSSIPKDKRAYIKYYMNDYRCILKAQGQEVTPDDTQQLHEQAVTFLESSIAHGTSVGLTNVVLTHHVPSHKGTSETKYEGTDGRYAYSTDLDRLLDDGRVKLWCCGHTHNNFRQDRNGCLLVSNQYGYGPGSTCKGFNPALVLEV